MNAHQVTTAAPTPPVAHIVDAAGRLARMGHADGPCPDVVHDFAGDTVRATTVGAPSTALRLGHVPIVRPSAGGVPGHRAEGPDMPDMARRRSVAGPVPFPSEERILQRLPVPGEGGFSRSPAGDGGIMDVFCESMEREARVETI